MTDSPVVLASQASWRCVQAGDGEGWLALMSEDIVIEDPIGTAVTNPDGSGVRGKEAVRAFFDTNIGPNKLTVTCQETFPSSSPTEIAYILVLRTEFPNGFVATVRGVFTYRVDDEGLITNLRGYWNMDAMTFSEVEKAD
ncbi:nuclear transport factor 2 family protein [Mycobacterium sp. AMU20-3851]|uniref:nuclear transport factor 2 family protein n=1 Tax=Mycobacterium sp. AMU20-3851 TaxID=3122055 RepID=UPI003753EC20